MTADQHNLYLRTAHQLLALDAVNGTLRWQREHTSTDQAYPILWTAGEQLFIIDDYGRRLTWFNGRTGESTQPLTLASQIMYYAYADADAPVDTGLLGNDILVLSQRLYPEGKQDDHFVNTRVSVRHWPDQEAHWIAGAQGTPGGLLIDGTSLVYRAGSTVRRTHLKNGTIIWETQLPDTEGTNLVRVGPVLWVGSRIGYIHALDWETGLRLWSQDLWTSLDPPWLYITVLGSVEDTLFARVKNETTSALVALATSDAATTPGGVTGAWPTPTPRPSPTPPPTVTPFPLPRVTRPPSNLPLDSPFALTLASATGTTVTVQAYIQIFADLLNMTGGDPDQVQAYIDAWKAEAQENVATNQPADTDQPATLAEQADYLWAHAANLDADRTIEWLVNIPVARGIEGMAHCHVCAMLVVFEYRGGLFTPVDVPFRTDLPNTRPPHIFAIEDINADRRVEILLESRTGSRVGGTSLWVRQWDGRSWLDLGSMWQADAGNNQPADIIVEDRDDDGRKEIVMHGGVIGGIGLERPRTDVYAWVEDRYQGRYQLVESTPDDVPNIYYRTLDANAALRAQNWDTALALAMSVVSNPNMAAGSAFSEEERARIVSYAAIEAMLVHAMRQESGAIEALLYEIEEKYSYSLNPYIEAAQQLWTVYRGTQDPRLACEAMALHVRERWNQAQFLQQPAIETLSLKHVCPLTDVE
jgi:hypothetical protein